MDSSRNVCNASEWQATVLGTLYHLQEALRNATTKKNWERVPKKFTPEALFMICVILIFLILSLIGSFISAWDAFYKTSPKKRFSLTGSKKTRNDTSKEDSFEEPDTDWFKSFRKFLDCFCIQKNIRKIFITTTKTQLDAINGIRTCVFFWVLFAHIGTYYVSAVKYPNDDFQTLIMSPIVQLIFDGRIPLEIFFILSGFLTSLYFCVEYSKKNGNISLLSFCVKRYFRFTQTYVIVLGFYTTLMSYTGYGPLWPTYNTNPVCKRTWIWNLFYLNIFQKQCEQCLQPSWFLACSMQMHVISPLFLIALIKWPRKGYVFTGVCILGSCLVRFILIVKFNLISGCSAIVFYLSDLKAFYERFFVHVDIIWNKPHTKLSPFLVGLVLGFYLHSKNFTKSSKPNRIALFYGWMTAAILVAINFFHNNTPEKSAWETAIYDTLVSLLFYIYISRIIYLCISGQAGWLNDFLSHKYFIPFSRLSFSAYLVNLLVIEWYFLSLEEFIEYSAVSLVLLNVYLLFWIFVVSFIVAVLFEIPLSRVADLFAKKLKE
ncbi:nose resistant to fluoxetine protein 6-like [Argiope bruennichi]|uniref:nose resistant to fluoxetine protein 6-like n=1 Tax=Argiope bruennichi TaxID=94029 RepID=UPI002494F7EC|nr:nose resistant to fluoxetine protein 6-like [Argiope bruennichi]